MPRLCAHGFCLAAVRRDALAPHTLLKEAAAAPAAGTDNNVVIDTPVPPVHFTTSAMVAVCATAGIAIALLFVFWLRARREALLSAQKLMSFKCEAHEREERLFHTIQNSGEREARLLMALREAVSINEEHERRLGLEHSEQEKPPLLLSFFQRLTEHRVSHDSLSPVHGNKLERRSRSLSEVGSEFMCDSPGASGLNSRLPSVCGSVHADAAQQFPEPTGRPLPGALPNHMSRVPSLVGDTGSELDLLVPSRPTSLMASHVPSRAPSRAPSLVDLDTSAAEGEEASAIMWRKALEAIDDAESLVTKMGSGEKNHAREQPETDVDEKMTEAAGPEAEAEDKKASRHDKKLQPPATESAGARATASVAAPEPEGENMPPQMMIPTATHCAKPQKGSGGANINKRGFAVLRRPMLPMSLGRVGSMVGSGSPRSGSSRSAGSSPRNLSPLPGRVEGGNSIIWGA